MTQKSTPDFTKWMARPSELGNILTSTGKPSKAMAHFRDKYTEFTRDAKKEIASKYFEKGNLTEQAGIGMINRLFYPDRFIRKNTETKSNGLIKGTCDLFLTDSVWDVKSAWDWFTFNKSELTHIYEWQVKAYCWLWGVKKGYLAYCLNNLPMSMLEDEYRKLFYNGKYLDHDQPEYLQACEELKTRNTYDHVPEIERVRVWEIELTDDDIERMKKAVEVARVQLAAIHYEIVENKERIFKIQKELKNGK